MAKHWYSTKRATTVTELDGKMACIYHQTPVVICPRWPLGKRHLLDAARAGEHSFGP